MVTMPCGLIIFSCYFTFVVIILVEIIASRPISIDRNQRELMITKDQTMNKYKRHSIFDDKNRADLGELVSYLKIQ